MNKLKIALLSLVTLTTACTSEINETAIDNYGKPIIVEATIGESTISRAIPRTDDKISYGSFKELDQIGLYATAGNGTSITNMPLEHNGKSFQSDKLQWIGGSISKIYAYFPYSSNPDQASIWRDAKDADGDKWEAGFNDMLAANISGSVTEGNVINMGFIHQFAMLVIKRGIGFDKASIKEVTIQLNNKVGKTAKINPSTLNLELQVDDVSGENELKTNPGQYQSADVDYVIIPIDKNNNGLDVNVASITLHNDLGRKLVVPYTISNSPAKNTKYVVTVEMRNNQAVVSPEEIVQWDDENIHFDIPVGIKDGTEFIEWAATYNDNSGMSIDEKAQIFKKYGSYKDSKWTFRLLEDIDLSKESFNGITSFTDIFDGQGHTIKGLQINEVSGSSSLPTGFVRTLSGTIQRLILEDAIIYGQTEIGAFAGKAITGAKIEKCKLTGTSIIFGTSNVGPFIGNNEVGPTAIENCSKASTVIVKENETK